MLETASRLIYPDQIPFAEYDMDDCYLTVWERKDKYELYKMTEHGAEIYYYDDYDILDQEIVEGSYEYKEHDWLPLGNLLATRLPEEIYYYHRQINQVSPQGILKYYQPYLDEYFNYQKQQLYKESKELSPKGKVGKHLITQFQDANDEEITSTLLFVSKYPTDEDTLRFMVDYIKADKEKKHLIVPDKLEGWIGFVNDGKLLLIGDKRLSTLKEMVSKLQKEYKINEVLLYSLPENKSEKYTISHSRGRGR